MLELVWWLVLVYVILERRIGLVVFRKWNSARMFWRNELLNSFHETENKQTKPIHLINSCWKPSINLLTNRSLNLQSFLDFRFAQSSLPLMNWSIKLHYSLSSLNQFSLSGIHSNKSNWSLFDLVQQTNCWFMELNSCKFHQSSSPPMLKRMSEFHFVNLSDRISMNEWWIDYINLSQLPIN